MTSTRRTVVLAYQVEKFPIRRSVRSLPTKMHTMVGSSPPNRSRVAANSAENRIAETATIQEFALANPPTAQSRIKAAAASHCRRSTTRNNIRRSEEHTSELQSLRHLVC